MDEGKEPLDALTYCEITSAGDQRSVRHPADDVDPLKDFVVGREIVGRYVLRSELGRGGMGMVFLARDSTLDRDVAIKVELKPSLDSVEPKDGQPDLAREARIAAILRHEGIASVFDFGIHASRPFTIFEYIEGQNLRRVMASKQGWTVGEVLQLVDRIADALDFAHAEGVVHSDLKPENICIRPDGSPVILDFGIARNLKTDADDVTFRGTATLWNALQKVMRRFKDDNRFRDMQIVEMLFYAQLRNKDIASQLGIDEKQVALVKHRLIKRLADELGSQSNALPDESLLSRVWEEQRPSCPKRSTVGKWLRGTLEPEWTDYVEFHIERLGCRFCQANRSDLAADTEHIDSTSSRQRIMQSSVGFFRKR